jgi:antitoxin (DNA-binding transcriptional repressor) of toxin-antitoxin stability system
MNEPASPKPKIVSAIDGLKGGSPVLIVDRGRPVARLEPVTGGDSNQDGRLSRLVREGVVRQGAGPYFARARALQE